MRNKMKIFLVGSLIFILLGAGVASAGCGCNPKKPENIEEEMILYQSQGALESLILNEEIKTLFINENPIDNFEISEDDMHTDQPPGWWHGEFALASERCDALRDYICNTLPSIVASIMAGKDWFFGWINAQTYCQEGWMVADDPITGYLMANSWFNPGGPTRLCYGCNIPQSFNSCSNNHAYGSCAASVWSDCMSYMANRDWNMLGCTGFPYWWQGGEDPQCTVTAEVWVGVWAD